MSGFERDLRPTLIITGKPLKPSFEFADRLTVKAECEAMEAAEQDELFEAAYGRNEKPPIPEIK